MQLQQCSHRSKASGNNFNDERLVVLDVVLKSKCKTDSLLQEVLRPFRRQKLLPEGFDRLGTTWIWMQIRQSVGANPSFFQMVEDGLLLHCCRVLLLVACQSFFLSLKDQAPAPQKK